MPRLSDSMVDGTIVAWLRAEGEEVKAGEEIVEIETDKAIMPYQAEHSGPLQIVAAAGELVAVGALIGYIGEPETVDAAAGAPAGAPASSAAPAGVATSAAPAGVATSAAPATAATAALAALPASQRAAGGSTNGRVKASPVARRLAAALGVDLHVVGGSGPGGRIVKRDVEGLRPVPASPGERRALTATQATIARRMVAAKQAPEFTVTVRVDMEAVFALREELRASGMEPLASIGDFVTRACALALCEHRRVNASFAEDAVTLHSRVNVGVAVAVTGESGSLLVPTLFDADRKPLGQIARETGELAALARAGRLTPEQMADATFTISNLGMYGVHQFTAVLSPPQAAILALGAAEAEVVVRDGAFEARRVMQMTLTSDHRVIYGADAAAFLASVRETLENPLKLLI